MSSKSVRFSAFLYVSWPPLLSMTTCMWRGKLDTSDPQYSLVISVTQTSLIACFKHSMVVCLPPYHSLSSSGYQLDLDSSRFCSWGNRWLIWIDDKERHLEWKLYIKCRCPYAISASSAPPRIHSSVRWNEIHQKSQNMTWYHRSFHMWLLYISH